MRNIKKVDAKPKTARPKRVAAYARVSSDKDAMLRSLSAQIDYYVNYINRRGDWEYAGIYADEAETGTKAARPEFQRLLTDCRDGKIDMVIVKSVSRFARNTVTTLESVRELKMLGVDIYFERENIHSSSGEGELMLTLLASFAQEESLSASENQKWRVRKKFADGIPTFFRIYGYRFRNNRLEIVPAEAAVVRQIFTDYLSGMGVNAIAKKLIRDGVPTMHGKRWRENAVMRILRNEKYTGDLLLQKTFVADHLTKKKRVNRGELPMYHVAESHGAVVDRDTFDMVQREIKRRADRFAPAVKPNAAHPFTGLIRCVLCGEHYLRKTVRANRRYEKAVWICQTFNTYGKAFCPARQIPENILTDKSAEALGLSAFDADALRNRVSQIEASPEGRLVFVFRDGSEIEVFWQNLSRRESWTEEMRQTARERQLKIIEERKKL
jgi:DNA invertase Pin-like site-specific DNA recombinase